MKVKGEFVQTSDYHYPLDKHPQDFYDAFNTFIKSSDHRVFDKLMMKYFFLNMTKDVPGDVVELGVFKGSGIFAWLKMLKHLHQSRKVYGFDFFNADALLTSIDTSDRTWMKNLFGSRGFDPLGYEEALKNQLTESGFSNFELIVGDVIQTIPVFLESNPGFRASLINFDLDLEKPTYVSLTSFWDRLVPGGVLVFDEYAINEWTESNGVDQFMFEKKVAIKTTNSSMPSAYIVKNSF